MVIQRKKDMSPPVETFLARIFWFDHDISFPGKPNPGMVVQIGKGDTNISFEDDEDTPENDEDIFYYHEGTEEEFFEEFSKDACIKAKWTEEFYAEKVSDDEPD